MAPHSKIVDLASTVLTLTSEIETHLAARGLPSPSLDLDAPADLPLPESLRSSRDTILAALDDLHALMAGPLPLLMRLTGPNINIFISLQAICRFQLATSFALDEQITFAELAERCGLSESDTRRYVRLAIANRIFTEPQKGIVAHNALSKLLVKVPPVRQYVDMVCGEMWFSGPRTIDAMQKWGDSEEPTHTGFALANGIEASFFEEISRNPKRAKRFADSMQFLQSSPPYAVSHLLNNLDWDSTCPALMVDIGGSYGSVSIEILRRYPRLRCIVQDLAEVIADANVPSDLKDRLEFREQNFFAEQSVKGADVYFLRSVLHDWSDKYATHILKSLIPALKDGARIILNEICLPEPGILSNYQDQMLRGYDLAMKQNFNGKERDADDWAKLFLATDERFKIVGIKTPPKSLLSIIEARWEGSEAFEMLSTKT